MREFTLTSARPEYFQAGELFTICGDVFACEPYELVRPDAETGPCEICDCKGALTCYRLQCFESSRRDRTRVVFQRLTAAQVATIREHRIGRDNRIVYTYQR